MPLFQLAGVSNFQSNSLSLFLSIVRIFSSEAISFQILLYALLQRLELGIDASTHMNMPPQTTLNYHILNLHNNTHPITKNISRHPINQSHPTHHPDHTTLHPTKPCLIRNSKFARFTRVKQNSSNTILINLFPLLQR